MIVTNSDISNFLECRRLWTWNYVHEYQPPEARHGARQRGDRVHRAIAHMYSGGTADPVAYHNALGTKDIAWMEAEGKPEWEVDRLYEDIIIGRRMVEAYVEWLADEGADAGLTVEGVEQTIEAPILGGDVVLRGKLDVKFRREDSGLLILNDLKTLGRWDSATRAGLERSYQHNVYMAIESLTRPDDPLTEAHYTVIQGSKLRARVERFKVPGTGRTVPNRLKNIEQIVIEMQRSVEEEIDYPTPSVSCGWCDYRKPCELADDSPAAAREYLEINFRVGTKHERYYTPLESDA